METVCRIFVWMEAVNRLVWMEAVYSKDYCDRRQCIGLVWKEAVYKAGLISDSV